MRAALLWALWPTLVFAQNRLTVADALKEALSSSPRLQAARSRADAAQDSADSLRGRMLPGIRLSDEQQHYDSPFTISLDPRAPGLTLRNVNTNTFAASVGQPVLGLLHLSQDHAALKTGAAAANESIKAAEAAVREEVQTGFLRYFEARALGETARASQQQLQEQVDVMESKVKAGVATLADSLRLKVAFANAKQAEIQAQAQEQVARAGILETVGRSPDDASVELVEPTELEQGIGKPPELVAQINLAAEHRPELAAATLRAEGERYRARARLFELLPEVNLEAAYLHIEGQIFAPKDSTFVGLKADWPIWEWGASHYAHRAAVHAADAAEAEEEDLRRKISTEVSAKLSQLRAATNAVEVAQATITSAEEAYRVTNALVKAGSATTTDLLDAQAALTQAKLNLVRARYEDAIAQVSLTRATGG